MRPRTLAIIAAAGLLIVVAAWLLTRPTPAPPEPIAAAPTATTTAVAETPAPTATTEPVSQQTAPTESIPAFVSPISPLPYAHRGIPLDSGRSASALTWLDIALENAQTWNEEAQFLGISPSFIMERNLPFLPAQAGWFYRFGREEDALELYIQVVDGVISGSTEAEAIGDREEPVPVDLSVVTLDSTDVREVYSATTEGEDALDSELDYTLAYDTNLDRPVWWVWDLTVTDESPVLAVDAATGETVPME